MTDHQPDQPMAQCRECGMEILAAARICGYCESYQAHWRNELRYFANIAGVFTVIGTAIFFSITLGPSLRLALFWNDHVEVVSVDGDEATIANAGDGNVFLYEIVFDWPDGRGWARTINDTLSAGSVMRLTGEFDYHHYHLVSDADFEQSEAVALRVLSESDTLWTRALSEAEWAQNRGEDMPCFEIVAVTRGGNFWSRYVRLRGSEPTTVPLNGRVRAFSLGRGEVFETPFTIDALLVFVFYETDGTDRDPETGQPYPPGLLLCEVQ